MAKPVRKSRIQVLDARRAQILEEAIRIIGTQGYNGFTIHDLARRCGLTNGGLLYHFPSKEHVLLAVLEEHDRQRGEQMIARFGAKLRTNALGDVMAIFQHMAGQSAAEPALKRLYIMIQAEGLNPSHPAHGYCRAREANTLAGFATLVAPLVSDAVATARQLHALMNGLVLQWLRDEQRFDLVSAWDGVITEFRWAAAPSSPGK